MANRLTRLLLGLVVALLLAACTDSAGPGSRDGDQPDAAAAKNEMDIEAERLLPDLVAAVGGRLDGMQATFHERGGFGVWDYTAAGSLLQPPGTVAESLAAVQVVLERHAFSVDPDEARKRVSGTKGNVSVIVEASLLSDEREGSGLNLTIGTIGGISDGDTFAESTPPEDYLAYVE